MCIAYADRSRSVALPEEAILSVRARKRGQMVVLGLLTTAVFAVVLMPVITLIVISFTSGDTLAFPPPGWSLRWYRVALNMFVGGNVQALGGAGGSERFLESLTTSIMIALTTVVIGLFVSVPAAYALVRFEFRGKRMVELAISFPTIYPLVVLGVSFLILSSLLGIASGFWRIVFAHTIITFPFVVRNCIASLRGLNLSLEEVAATLGARPYQIFRQVTLPLIQPGVLSGMLLAFMLSFNEFTASFFLYTSQTLPVSMWMYSQASNDLNPVIFALSTLFVIFNALLIWALEKLSGASGSSS
jgi:putative spermidine/putrescine transport system permease protein